MTTDFLVTGCGRSGTAWAARLFTELGFPCTHEGQFNLAVSGPLRGAESSWLAMPHIDSLDPSTSLLRIVRDPYAVVQSIVARGFLRDMDGPYEKYALRHAPVIDRPDHLGRAIRYVALWDLLMPFREHVELRTDDPAAGLANSVLYATGHEPSISDVLAAMKRVGTKTNTNPLFSHTRHVTRQEIDAHPDGGLVRARAMRHGYA